MPVTLPLNDKEKAAYVRLRNAAWLQAKSLNNTLSKLREVLHIAAIRTGDVATIYESNVVMRIQEKLCLLDPKE